MRPSYWEAVGDILRLVGGKGTIERGGKSGRGGGKEAKFNSLKKVVFTK